MKKFLILSGFLALPLVAGAQGSLGGVLDTVLDLINTLIPIVIALAVLYFFWGLAQYILNSANEEKKAEGRNIMIWGIIALFVMVSVWGLIRILQNTFDVGSDVPIVPQRIERNSPFDDLRNYPGSYD